MDDVKTMSETELRSHLITSDYRGRTYKEQVLDELLRRAQLAKEEKETT